MGRILGSPHPARFLVVASSGFACAHLTGLVLWSGLGGMDAPEWRALAIALGAVIAWTMAILFAVDRSGRGGELVTRIAPSRLARMAGFATVAAALTAVAVTMIFWNDESSNVAAANFLIEKGFANYFASYATINDWLGPHHPPVLPVIYASYYAVFGASVGLGRVLAVVCSLLALGVGYQWITHRAGGRAGFLAVAGALSIPMTLFAGTAAILDAPFFLFFTLAVIAWERFLESRTYRDAIVCGFIVGLAMLSRYNGVLLPVLFFAQLVLLGEERSRLRDPRTWVALATPAIVALPWILVAAASGTLMPQVERILSFVLIAVVPPGGAFYLKQMIVPLLPFMIGIWNLPVWIHGGMAAWRDRDGALGRRLVVLAAVYVVILAATLPNPRYILSIAIPLGYLAARSIEAVEMREGRGFAYAAHLLGLTAIHVVFVLHQTSDRTIYLFY
ncbi:glycosyltransferase family 39 protein [bacterium]|nr:glycosyltransferase family 39 protein [bacterium]